MGPHLWFRNTWWVDEQAPRPELTARDHHKGSVIAAKHPALGQRFLYCDGPVDLLFTDNETNRYRLWGQPNPTQYQKDGINDYVVQGRETGSTGRKKGTKSAAHTVVTVQPGQSATAFACASPTPRQAISPIRLPISTRSFWKPAGATRTSSAAITPLAERRRGERRPPGTWRSALLMQASSSSVGQTTS